MEQRCALAWRGNPGLTAAPFTRTWPPCPARTAPKCSGWMSPRSLSRRRRWSSPSPSSSPSWSSLPRLPPATARGRAGRLQPPSCGRPWAPSPLGASRRLPSPRRPAPRGGPPPPAPPWRAPSPRARTSPPTALSTARARWWKSGGRCW
ncbi:hypothetical protein I4F81_004850 [Pyropia yezoensis]|uniref:Uncharacterized protein n=1 Tax=Pyropia yezoensis TaxID=2788 RepID=A0ACC3BW76_PYRYE|nr:hypothetical protein I4F81_004850 [Neopyropia yezoensis]